jgi:hypothetical protein
MLFSSIVDYTRSSMSYQMQHKSFLNDSNPRLSGCSSIHTQVYILFTFDLLKLWTRKVMIVAAIPFCFSSRALETF